MLVHCDPDLLLKLDCDVSAYGVGAELSHVFLNGVESQSPVSRTLTQIVNERGYTQLEKAVLSRVWNMTDSSL